MNYRNSPTVFSNLTPGPVVFMLGVSIIMIVVLAFAG